MSGPTRVSILVPSHQPTPGPALIGVIVANVIHGDDLANWEVKEFIEFDDEESNKESFAVKESFASGWLAAQLAQDEQRIDEHLLSTGAIQFGKMKKDGTEYKCLFTQTFRKRQRGQESTSHIDNSGFKIVHTIAFRNGQWEYFSEKTASDVLGVKAGTGTIRQPAQGWARVPGGF